MENIIKWGDNRKAISWYMKKLASGGAGRDFLIPPGWPAEMSPQEYVTNICLYHTNPCDDMNYAACVAGHKAFDARHDTCNTHDNLYVAAYGIYNTCSHSHKKAPR